LIKWAGIAYLLFIARQLAQPHPQATRKDLNSTGFKPLLFLAVRCLSVRQSESMDARCGHRQIVHGEQCGRRQYRNYCDCVFRSLPLAALSLGAWVDAALRNWLAIGSRMGTFNVAMEILLASTAMWLAML
jgi:hypothetical protein